MHQTLYAEDIIPCLNRAVALSFVKVESNRKAIADHGWYPPTKKLLDDPQLHDLEDIAKQTFTGGESHTKKLLDSFVLTKGKCAGWMGATFQQSSIKNCKTL